MRTFWKLCLIVAMTGAAASAAESPKASTAVVDFAKSIGKIRAIHGVGNGPVNWGIGADLTNYHKEAGFPSARLHDGVYGGLDAVDIHCIFPIFDADADDPKYYTFAKTDAYLGAIVKNGTQITYRLGESIECRSRHYYKGGLYTHPPKDYAKWAKICVNIIRHYNEGWANGFHYNIKHWEIWNEPENGVGMWDAPLQRYFELYAVAAKAIKSHDPTLKVGGPATCFIGGASAKPFLTYCRDNKLPMDFLTYHGYADSPHYMADYAVAARKLLDEFGFKNAESHLTEWHPMWYGWGDGPKGWVEGQNFLGDCNDIGNPTPQKYATMRARFDRMRGPEAAAFAASALMLMQDAPLDMANYYTADTNPWGMFDSFGVPGRVYYAFVAFNRLTKTPNRVAVTYDDAKLPDITTCAGLSDDRKTASILLSNFSPSRVQ